MQRGVRASYSSVQGGVGAIHCSVFIRFQREVRAYLLGAIQCSVLIPAQRKIRAKYSSVLSDVGASLYSLVIPAQRERTAKY